MLLDSLCSLEEYYVLYRSNEVENYNCSDINDHNDINGFNEHESRIRITSLVFHRESSIKNRVSITLRTRNTITYCGFCIMNRVS
jgi:hypothetical protein